jgi:hypothetical protein
MFFGRDLETGGQLILPFDFLLQIWRAYAETLCQLDLTIFPGRTLALFVTHRLSSRTICCEYLQEVRLAGGEDELVRVLKGAKMTKPVTVDPAVLAQQPKLPSSQLGNPHEEVPIWSLLIARVLASVAWGSSHLNIHMANWSEGDWRLNPNALRCLLRLQDGSGQLDQENS